MFGPGLLCHMMLVTTHQSKCRPSNLSTGGLTQIHGISWGVCMVCVMCVMCTWWQ